MPTPCQVRVIPPPFLKKTLEENKDARWTIVLLHKPLWTQGNLPTNGWLEAEKLLAGRGYTVFAGHVHRYQKFVRQGQNYYQLATTGGGSRMRGVPYGEFDQIAWVTMKPGGPVLANLLLDGIYPEDLRQSATGERGVVEMNRKPTHPVRGQVVLDGCPVEGAMIAFHLIGPDGKRTTHAGDAVTEADGTFVLSTYTASDGSPAGDFVVTVSPFEPPAGPTKAPPLPPVYRKATVSPLRATVKAGKNDFAFELKSDEKAPMPKPGG